jgi:hypothetical protein
MRFFEQKKTLKPDDLSVFKGFEAFLAEWTGHELSSQLSHCQYVTNTNFKYFTNHAMDK